MKIGNQKMMRGGFFLLMISGIILIVGCISYIPAAENPTPTPKILAEAFFASLTPTATPTPTATRTIPPSLTPSLTPTKTSTPTLEPTMTPTTIPTSISTPYPVITNTPISITPTLIPPSVTPTLSGSSELPGNAIPLTGGSYGSCPFLTLGQYQTNPSYCSDCSIDLLYWTIGGWPDYPEGVSTLHQVLGAYELNGEIFLRLTNNVDVSLNAMTYRDLEIVIDLEKAIGTWMDAAKSIRLSPEEFLALMGEGTTISYTINTVYGWQAVSVGTICEQ
ncbi:MAG: hypothetical protein QNJ45_20680 [Ardenticatenaceae bacterium]|nr:hypothetical protein [Ardenticatenaceae bacterium]